jgi:hypothetical protein
MRGAPDVLRYILALASLAGGLAWLSPGHARDQGIEVDAELVFSVDVSYSMDRVEQELQRNGYVQALTSPDFLNALKSNALGKVAIAYMQWASYTDQDVLLDWTVISGPESAQAAAEKLAAAPYRRARRTSISGAIDSAARLFNENGFKGARQIIDVSGDGPNNDGRPVVEARADALARGITINGLPLVGIRPYLGYADIKDLDIYYEDCVIGGPDAFMISIHDTKSFVDATRSKLVREIARAPTSPATRLVQRAQASEPRISCTIGENLWRSRGYN